MPIVDLFSKRQKRLRGDVSDVFQYDMFPDTFRTQVVYILKDMLGTLPKYTSGSTNDPYFLVHQTLCREYGVLLLSESGQRGDYTLALLTFVLQIGTPEQILDVLEESFKIANDKWPRRGLQGIEISPLQAREELNTRFLEHGLGFQLETDEIIRIDSKLIHSEVVKPTLVVLSEEIYKGANDEFLKAHEHYRHGRIKECLNECLKSFESTLKAICAKRGWQFAESDTAKKLIAICFDNKLIPPYLETQFSSLRSVLESGVPTVRNRLSGHGQGSQQIAVPRYMAEYALHLTATSILFLANAEKELK